MNTKPTEVTNGLFPIKEEDKNKPEASKTNKQTMSTVVK